MGTDELGSGRHDRPNPNDAIRRWWRREIVLLLVRTAILFVSAGRLDWRMGWVFVGVYVGSTLINGLVIVRNDPALAKERLDAGAGIKDWDRVLVLFAVLLSVPGTLLVSGLDTRFGWSQNIPFALQIMAALANVLGIGLTLWAVASNTFFSGYVRIQEERGQTVVSSGPYAFVRHPGYLGAVVSCISTSLMLGSWWALIPSGLGTLGFVVRTALEDTMLRNELEGYKEYAVRVRYRLLPGIW